MIRTLGRPVPIGLTSRMPLNAADVDCSELFMFVASNASCSARDPKTCPPPEPLEVVGGMKRQHVYDRESEYTFGGSLPWKDT